MSKGPLGPFAFAARQQGLVVWYNDWMNQDSENQNGWIDPKKLKKTPEAFWGIALAAADGADAQMLQALCGALGWERLLPDEEDSAWEGEGKSLARRFWESALAQDRADWLELAINAKEKFGNVKKALKPVILIALGREQSASLAFLKKRGLIEKRFKAFEKALFAVGIRAALAVKKPTDKEAARLIKRAGSSWESKKLNAEALEKLCEFAAEPVIDGDWIVQAAKHQEDSTMTAALRKMRLENRAEAPNWYLLFWALASHDREEAFFTARELFKKEGFKKLAPPRRHGGGYGNNDISFTGRAGGRLGWLGMDTSKIEEHSFCALALICESRSIAERLAKEEGLASRKEIDALAKSFKTHGERLDFSKTHALRDKIALEETLSKGKAPKAPALESRRI